MRADSSLLSPDGCWRWDGTAWQPVVDEPSRVRRHGPTAVIACITGIAVWIPVMASMQLSGPPRVERWAWYLGLMFVASVVLGAVSSDRWQSVGVGLVAPQLVLAIFSNPREHGGPWLPIFPILCLVAASATGVAYLTARLRRRSTSSAPIAPAGYVLSTLRVFVVAGVVGVALLTFGAWLVLVQPFQDTEDSLRKEARSLHVPGSRIIASEYRPGGCLDNCPHLSQTYRFARPISCRRFAQVVDQFETTGYHGYSAAGYLFSARRSHFSVTVVAALSHAHNDRQTCSAPTDRFDTLYVGWEY